MTSKVIRTANTLSLDVVTGAVLSALFAARLLSVTPGIAYWIILPVSVWVVYTADHLVDAYRLKDNAHTQRHLFHYRHFKTLTMLVLLFSMLNTILAVFFLDHRIVIFGLVVGGVTALYLLAVHLLGESKRYYLQKELFVAVIYVSGVWGGPWALSGFGTKLHTVVLFFIFFLLAIGDVLIYTIYEYSTDRLDHHPTLFSLVGRKTTLVLFFGIMAMAAIGSIFVIVESPFFLDRAAGKIYLMMGFALLVLVSFPELFRPHNRYRYLGEMVFWLPGILSMI